MKELKERLLSETAAHYKIGNRGVYEPGGTYGGTCVYENALGCRCAIGRLMTNKGILMLREMKRLRAPLHGVIGLDVFREEWKPLIHKDNNSFLQDIQGLHDREVSWTLKGLSAIGKECVEYIKKRYQLD